MLETSQLWRDIVTDVGKEYPDVALSHMYVDNAAMQLVRAPRDFDVIVTGNLFGDILSDEIAGLVGGLGLAPGANIGEHAAIFEAVHGSAPDIAGKGIANPLALLSAAAMMLDHVNRLDLGNRVRQAIHEVLITDGIRTQDLGGKATTAEVTEALLKRVQ